MNNYIAPSKTYSAGDFTGLKNAFDAISKDITTGLSSGTVKDRLPAGITSTDFGAKTEWNLSEADGFTCTTETGNTTYYTYTKTYTVMIDPENETVKEIAAQNDGYYPLNGETTLTVGDGVVINFPIPAGKVVMPTYPVTWKDYDGDTLKSENLKHGTPAGEVKANEPDAPTRPADDKYTYTFTGWTPAYEDVTGSQTYTANYDKKARAYTVSYQYEGTAPANAPALPDSELHQYKTEVTVKDKPILDGYRFSGWTTSDADVSRNSFTMPAKNVTFTGSWEATEFLLTINYVYAGGGEAAKPHTEKVQCNTTYSVTSPVLDGYTADTPVVSGTMPAQPVTVTVTYTKRSDLSYTVNYYWNGTTDKAAESKTVENQTFGTDVTESPIAIDGYTPVSEDSQAITIGTGSNVITFYYYKDVELTANSKTETYDGTEKSVSGFTGAPDGADFSAITVGAKGIAAGNYPAEFPENTVGTVDKNGKYIVEEYKNGMLTISPVADKVTVTITGHTGSAIYDGTEKSVTGYDVSIDNDLYKEADFTFTGTAEAKGTNAGTYPMGLTKESFENTNKNFTNVVFVVEDGYLKIKRHSVATPSKPTLNTGDHYAYVMGYPDGTVRPNGSITRAEVSAILFRLLSDKTRDEYFTTESSFTDVKAGAWYNNSIATLEKAGVIVDTAKGGAFRPNEAITRAELAAMLAQFSDAKPVKGVKFSDVSAEHWAYEAIAIAAKMGWIEGYPDGTFRPDATITRAEMMTLVNRALERVPSDEDHLLSKRVMLTFPDCKSGDWFYIAVQEATNSHTYERAATEKNGDEQWTALRANRDWTLLEK